MLNRVSKTTKAIVAVAVTATLVGASSSVGAFAQTGSSLVSGESSTVGSGGFATANLSYATAWVSGPTTSSQPKTFTASSPTTAAAAAIGGSASASTTPATQAPSGPSTGQPPTGGLPPIQLPGLPPIQLPGLPPIQLPGAPVQLPDLTGSSPSVQTATVTDALNDALDRIRELGVDVPDLPEVPLPPVTGLEVKAALLALLTTTQTQTAATVTAAKTATLAALATTGFGTQAGAVFDQAMAISTAAFDQARAAVLAMDPAELNNTPGEVIPMLAAAQLTIVQQLTQATAALLAVAGQFA